MKNTIINKLAVGLIAAVGSISVSACKTNDTAIANKLENAKSFLYVQGWDGTSKDSKHQKWFDVLTFGLDLSTQSEEELLLGRSKPCAVSIPADGKAGKVGQYIDKGSLVSTVKIDVINTSKSSDVTCTYTFSNVVFTNVVVLDLTETLQFTCTNLVIKYTSIKPDGTRGGAVETAWDFSKHY